MRQPCATATTLVVLVLSVLLALPAAAAPRSPAPDLDRSPREPGNPVAHCLPDRGDETDESPETEQPPVAIPETEQPPVGTPETEQPPVETPETEQPPAETGTAALQSETATPPTDADGVARCVLDSLPDVVGNPHAAAIVDVVVAGIANGHPDGTFRPNQDVTRGQMATFITRALDLHGDGDNDLADVDGNPHAAAIDAVTDAGIANGFVDGTFRPNAPVTRGQMAAFLTRALDLHGDGDNDLPDVAGNPHAAAIDALVDAGITVGFADGTFRPADAVRRGQMASFLDRALDL